MNAITSKPDYGAGIAKGKNELIPATDRMQQFMDDIDERFNGFLLGANGVRLPSYVKASLPAVPPAAEPSMIFVSDDVGGAVPAFSDGTDWRRVTDRAVIA